MTNELVDAVHWFWLARRRLDVRAATRPQHDAGAHVGQDRRARAYRRTSARTLDRAKLSGLRTKDEAVLREWRERWDRGSQPVPAGDWGPDIRTHSTRSPRT